MGLHPALEVRTFHTYGFPCKGIFVKEGQSIKKGETIWFLAEGELFRSYTKQQLLEAPTTPTTVRELDRLGESNVVSSHTQHKDIVVQNPRETFFTYAYMIGDDCFSSTPYSEEDVSFYMNHTCDPNCGYRGDELIVATRDIAAGEQANYDYAFTETQDSTHYGMMCKCGTSRCRGFLDFLNYKDPVFIEENYGNCTDFIKSKMREIGWAHDGVVKRKCMGQEYGLVAVVPIPRLTPVIVFAGKVVSGNQVAKMSPRDQQMSLQVGRDLWQIPSAGVNGSTARVFDTGDYINHSCDPTCGMSDSTTVVSMRDIRAGESLTIDYAMVNSDDRELYGDSFECACGAVSCRKFVRPDDYLIVGRKYLDFMSPFCREKFHDMAPLKETRLVTCSDVSDTDVTTASELTSSSDSE